jgi:hypothetical protein
MSRLLTWQGDPWPLKARLVESEELVGRLTVSKRREAAPFGTRAA